MLRKRRLRKGVKSERRKRMKLSEIVNVLVGELKREKNV